MLNFKNGKAVQRAGVRIFDIIKWQRERAWYYDLILLYKITIVRYYYWHNNQQWGMQTLKYLKYYMFKFQKV